MKCHAGVLEVAVVVAGAGAERWVPAQTLWQQGCGVGAHLIKHVQKQSPCVLMRFTYSVHPANRCVFVKSVPMAQRRF